MSAQSPAYKDGAADSDIDNQDEQLLPLRSAAAHTQPAAAPMLFGFVQPPFANVPATHPAISTPAAAHHSSSHDDDSVPLLTSSLDARRRDGNAELDAITVGTPASSAQSPHSPLQYAQSDAGTAASSSAMFYSAYSAVPPRSDIMPPTDPMPSTATRFPVAQHSHSQQGHSMDRPGLMDTAVATIKPMEMSRMSVQSVDISGPLQPPQQSRWTSSSIYAEKPVQHQQQQRLAATKPSMASSPAPAEFNKPSLYQTLLTTAPDDMDNDDDLYIDSDSAAVPHHDPRRQYRDIIYGTVYTVAVTLMIVIGIVYAATAQPLSSEFKQSAAYAFDRTRSYFTGIIVVSALAGILWLWALKRFIKVVLWLTVLLIPVGFMAVGVWSMQSAFASDAANPSLEPRWLLPESLMSFGAAVLSSLLIRRRHKDIVRGISLVELAFEVLRDNPTVFAVSLVLLVGYILFSVVWFLLFSRILLMGHIESSGDGSPASTVRQWIPDPSSKWLISYFIIVYLWTSAIFTYIDRCAISGAVCEWYFHRNDPLRNAVKRDLAWQSLRRAATFSFGSICLAGLIVTVAGIVRRVARQMRRVARFGGSTATSSSASASAAVTVASLPVRLIGRAIDGIEYAVEGLNSYALVYVAYSGDGFCQSARNCLLLMRRNLISALLMDTGTKLVLSLGVYVMASVSFIATYNFAAHVTQTPYAMAVSAFGCVVPWLMLRFCTSVLQQVMDVLYVCYVIDLDTDKCHSVAAREIFGGDQTRPVSIPMQNTTTERKGPSLLPTLS